MILAGDVGGTKTTLALFDRADPHTPVVAQTYPSREHAAFSQVITAFVTQHPAPIELACVGIAGPVKDNHCRTTNLPWSIDGGALATSLGIGQAWLLNDLEAFAHGVAVLDPDDVVELQAGAPDARGNRAIIAAGTGLGEAGLFWDGKAHHPFSSEGGHADFGPHDELQIELLRFLLAHHPRVSWETVVSGMGIVNIYRFLKETGREEEPAWLADAMRRGDPGAVISKHGRERTNALCSRTLDLFATLYGAEAGNLALKVMATGGLYVAGGVARKNPDVMRSRAFLEAFSSKGPMRPVLEAVPVRMIVNDQTALIGAARCAVLRAGGG
jgi:glucokinase